VSFANDAASELAYPVVPLFLTVTLGAPVAVVGLIEGIAEGIAVGLRGLSGWLSDRWGERRLPWVTGGYAGSAGGRVVIAAAPAWGWVLAGRVVDRLGKGARTAPRDALIRDSTPAPLLGAAFGYHRALDTAGAVVGPLTAVVLLWAGMSFRNVLWVAIVPGFAALLLLRAVREAPSREREAVVAAARGRLPRAFWLALGVWVVFSLGNSSDVFLLLRAKNLGLGATLVVLAYSAYNVVYAGLSWPLGALSDRGRERVLGAGLVVFALVYLGFAVAPGSWAVWPLFALYGAYIAATDGVARAWVADRVPGRAIGTAYGVFSAATGAALLAASIAAGLLWSHVSPAAPFVVGASAAALAFVLLILSSPMRARGATSPDAPPQP
jgi:MFS family permease